MNVLLVDAGNARLKWVLSRDQGIGEVVAGVYDGDQEQIFTRFAAAIEHGIDAVVVGNVAGPQVGEKIRAAVRECSGIEAWFAQSRSETAGVRNGYAEPQRLGVDRWAAIVAAWRRADNSVSAASVCVVDAGTALTVDAVVGEGEHLGGLILPGLRLQQTALFESTADLASTGSETYLQQVTEPFSRNTHGALGVSGPFACAAAVDRCMAHLESHYGNTQLLLTGGDAGRIAPWLASSFEICPNLVFEGLAILFEQERSR